MFEPYSIVLFVHVLAAFVLVGHSFGSPFVRAAVREASTLEDLRRIVTFELRVSRWNPLAAGLLLVTGIYLGSAGWWYQGWFFLSAAGWLINAVLAGLIVHKGLSSLAAAAGSGPVTADVDALRRSRKLAVASQVMLANDVAILFMMYNKPSLVESLAACLLANAVVVGLSFLPRRAAAPSLSEAGS